MVYCGKPSKACKECRIKRRKCDLSRSSCGQCLRARVRCSGYRDQVALGFRDQSVEVTNRARAPGNPSRGSRSPNRNNLSSVKTKQTQLAAIGQHIQKYLDCALHSGITLSIKQQATPFFFYHYLLDETTLPIGHADCLALINGRASARGYLSSIIDAIGLASLSNLKREPKIMYDANSKYSLALERIRVGLAEPAEATSDQMLVSVMLLTLYETVTHNTKHVFNSWERHIYGALTLLQLRGIDQLNFKMGRRLFLQLRTEVLISCLQRNVPVPQMMLNWMSEAQKLETKEEMPDSRLASIIVDVCTIYANTKSCHSSDSASTTDFSRQVLEALSVDEALANWSTNLPSSYKYSTIIMTGNEDLHLGLHHIYTNLWIAYTWNLFRCARILVHQTLIQLMRSSLQSMPLAPKNSLYGSSLQTSEAVIYESVTGICSSVPFILGIIRQEGKNSSAIRAASALALLWPLHIAGTACPARQSLGEWVVLQLEKIGATTGIKKAKTTAITLREMTVPNTI